MAGGPNPVWLQRWKRSHDHTPIIQFSAHKQKDTDAHDIVGLIWPHFVGHWPNMIILSQ